MYLTNQICIYILPLDQIGNLILFDFYFGNTLLKMLFKKIFK